MCPFLQTGSSATHPSSAESEEQGLRGLCPGGRRDSAHPASGRPLRKCNLPPQSATAGVGGGGSGAARQARSSRRTPVLPHRGRPGRPRHPHPSFFLGRLCSLNPLPTLTQSPQKLGAAWAGAPTPTSPSRAGGLTAARQALAQSTEAVHIGAAHADHTLRARVGGLPACQGHGVRSQPLTSLAALGGVRAWAPDGWVCAGVGAGPRML